MPDTELMDQVLAIITEVPELHNQAVLVETLPEVERRDAEQELSGASAGVVGLVPDCNSAYCVGGWVLVLRGYRYDRTAYHWVGPDGVRLVSPPLLNIAAEALGIPVREARMGIFWEDSDLEDLELWVSYYKGETAWDELQYRLGATADA